MSAPVPAPAPRGVSMPTVVFGALLALVAAVGLLRELADVRTDVGTLAPVVLLVAGGLLVVWAVVGLAVRSTRRTPTSPASPTSPTSRDDARSTD